MDIRLDPDMNIEPGHQVIVLPATSKGNLLARLLTETDDATPFVWPLETSGFEIRIPHTADVDVRIVELIDQLSHVRFSAPGLIQMKMKEIPDRRGDETYYKDNK